MKAPHSVDVYIAKKLKEIRHIKGQTQQEVATAIGISYQQIQKLERAQNQVSIVRLYDIARYLKVPITQFLPPAYQDVDFPNSNNVDSKELEIINRSYCKIADPKQRKKVQDIIKLYAKYNRFCPSF